MPLFLEHCLEELWVRSGVGDTTQYLPLHYLFRRLDICSNIGTQKALKADPAQHLGNLGNSPSLQQDLIDEAEAYLIKTVTPKSKAL